jgi:nitroreductase
MTVTDAIRHRRAVRSFTAEAVEEATLHGLIDAAIQARSALNAQPWAFVVIDDRALLADYDERAKAHYLTLEFPEPYRSQAREILSAPGYWLFHGARPLIVIYARSGGHHDNVADCFLAAQNLVLAACEAGLGTCPIGFARPFFGLPEVKEALEVSPESQPALPLIVGHPAGDAPAPGRTPAQILSWRHR